MTSVLVVAGADRDSIGPGIDESNTSMGFMRYLALVFAVSHKVKHQTISFVMMDRWMIDRWMCGLRSDCNEMEVLPGDPPTPYMLQGPTGLS